MKVGIHPMMLDSRGNSTVSYDYAVALRDILGHEPFIVTSRPQSTHPLEMFKQFGSHFYEDPSELPGIIEREKIDVLYMPKAGTRDSITPPNVKTAIHCIFDMREEHGTVYAGVSEWLAKFFNKTLYVPHIINLPKTPDNIRSELGIPNDAFVIGRLGGYEQFDIQIAHRAIATALNQRSDLWAIFLNTKPFIDHPRAKFIPFQSDRMFKSQFINTCDAMIHARSDGETFGLAVGEFSSMNRPVITFDADYWWYMRAHIHMLDDRAILYKNEAELTTYLLDITKNYVAEVDWDRYSVQYSPENVIKKFQTVFLS